MKMRLLPADEWAKVLPLLATSFPGTSEFPPPPPLSFALVAEDDRGEIKAALFFKQEFHMEPFCAEPGNGHLYPDMVRTLEAILLNEVGPLYYLCTMPDRPERISREVELGRTILVGHVVTARRLE